MLQAICVQDCCHTHQCTRSADYCPNHVNLIQLNQAMFIHHFKFEVADALANIRAHTPDDNAERVALSNQLVGIDNFVSSLKKAAYLKSRIVSSNELPDTN